MGYTIRTKEWRYTEWVSWFHCFILLFLTICYCCVDGLHNKDQREWVSLFFLLIIVMVDVVVVLLLDDYS